MEERKKEKESAKDGERGRKADDVRISFRKHLSHILESDFFRFSRVEILVFKERLRSEKKNSFVLKDEKRCKQ